MRGEPVRQDLPGGFGWLRTTTDCQTPSSTTGWYDDKPGVPPPSSCDPAEMAALVGKVVHVPIYDDTNGLGGSNGEYQIGGYAAFFLTGYKINGQYKVASIIQGQLPCSGNLTCISGFFLERPARRRPRNHRRSVHGIDRHPIRRIGEDTTCEAK